MWKRIRKCIPVFIVCILLLFYIILWYKQFTYFHYSGESFFLSDERLNSIAQDAEEKEFIVEAAFSEKIGSVVFWPTIYSDITVENKGQETVVITISDYEGGDVPCAMEPVAIPADEEYRFVADGRGSYLITAYSSVQQGADDIHIQYDNHGYMNRWKKAVYALLGSVVLLVCVYMVFTLVKGEKISAVMPWVYFGGSLVAGLSGIVLRLSGWEDWSYTCLRFLAVYLGGLAVCSSIYKRDTESAGQNGASGKKKSYLCSLIISGGVALVFHFSFLTAKSTSILWHLTGTLDSGRRIKGYIIVFVVFLLTFLLLSNCRYSERILNLVKSFVRDKVSVCSIICILFILCDIHNEWNLLALAAFVLLIVYVRFQPEIRMPKWWWTLYYGVIVLLIAADHCVVDFWGIHGGGAVYHTGTFYHSIYYVANGLPFGGGLNQMYGHFALFYKLPLMLFGNNMLTVGMTTAFFSGIAACCLLIFLYRVLRNDGSRLIAGVVVLNCFVIGMIYLQTFPLRMLWPFALMLYCTLIKNENANIRVRLGGYVICILAIVWNMESGLVCAVAWAVCMAVWGQKKCRTQDYLLGMIRELIFVVAEVGIAYLLVKCYNTSCMDAAGRMDELLNWKKEMPTLAREEAGDTSNGRLFWSNAPWIGIELVLMCSTSIWVKKILVNKEKADTKDMPLLFLTVFSAGIFIYWMGRPEEYDIIAPFLGALLLIAFDRVTGKRNEWNTDFRKALYVILTVVLSFGIAGYAGHTVEKFRITYKKIVEERIWDYEAVKGFMQVFADNLPENTYAEAYGARMIYMTLGRPMENDGLGWGSGTMDLENKIRDQQWVLLSGSNMGISYLQFEKNISFGEVTYTLYKNTGYGK